MSVPSDIWKPTKPDQGFRYANIIFANSHANPRRSALNPWIILRHQIRLQVQARRRQAQIAT